ncbi:N-methyl-L-tryptophan oxidase [Streptomyces sp. 769]|uniref:N-methyl-L-tryptophan oxidase n=1 Tax=Streptomyces sp. 769 TaxID=1262452 RepID=UPI0005820C18|nr:N-methyl-L-tryptophan oxidase [Streptomyces sp. 769]AJC62129.1 sarcosine oxidase [Streptomyces sp. 769]
MTRWDADVAVIGLGAWGSAALWQLAARGTEVIGVERFGLGHALGSSHGGSRMFRVTCLEHPGLVPLARRSLELWRDLETQSGESLLHQGGGLLIGPPDGVIAGGTLRAADEHGIEIEPMTAEELNAVYPQHAGVPQHHIGVREPSAGISRPELSVRAAVDLARAAGARVLTGTQVTALTPCDGGVEVTTGPRTLRVRQAVITVGAWLPTLVPGLPLTTTRMPITWFRPVAGSASADAFDLERFPVFMRELDNGAVLWGSGRENGFDVKLGLEYAGGGFRPMDPEDTDRSVGSKDWWALSKLLAHHIPGLEQVPARAAVCMYSATPDNQFVIGRPGGDPRLVVAGGCNAHGAKHAPGIGEALADLVLEGKTRIPLDFAAPDRFR